MKRKRAPEKNREQADSRLYVRRFTPAIICGLLAAIVWIVFGQTLWHDFVNYDDPDYVYENPEIRNGLSIEGVGWAFTHVVSANWHPLTIISHMVDCQLYGVEPWGHHLTNVLLHAVAAALLFLALWKLTRSCWPSAFVAAVFAIHPLHVESVAWVAERKDILSGVFFALTLLAYERYVRSPQASAARYATALLFFALGLMCKPTLVTLPFVLLLLDYWPLRRVALRASTLKRRGELQDRRRNDQGTNPSSGAVLPSKSIRYLLAEKAPFFVLSIASCMITLLAQERAVIALRQLSIGDRLANAVMSYVLYVARMFWPGGLATTYTYPLGGWNINQVILACLVLLIMSAAFFVWRFRFPFLLVGWLWFLGMLVPMIGIVQVGMQARANRYTYLSQIGLYLLVTWGAMELFARWRRGREVSIVAAVLIVSGLMVHAYAETSFWRDSITMWNHALANTTNNYNAHTQLADALMKKGQVDEAIVHLREALRLSDFPTAHYNLGYALASKSNWAEAIPSFQAAIRVRPNYPQAHSNLAVSLSKVGKTDESLFEFGEALRLDYHYRDAHRNLAVLLLELGRRDDAVAHFREALRLNPDDPPVREQLRQLGAEQ